MSKQFPDILGCKVKVDPSLRGPFKDGDVVEVGSLKAAAERILANADPSKFGETRTIPDDTNQQILACLTRIEDMLAPICAKQRKIVAEHEQYIEAVKRGAMPKGDDQCL